MKFENHLNFNYPRDISPKAKGGRGINWSAVDWKKVVSAPMASDNF